MNKYTVRITNMKFTSATITVYAENQTDARQQALYGRPQFIVQWTRLTKRDCEKPIRGKKTA